MKLDLLKIYNILSETYGPQGWWPLISFAGTNPTMRGRLTGYHPNNFSLPETEAEMLEIMLGALLTQNTSWINAEKALFELYSQNLIDINALLNIPTENLAILIKSQDITTKKQSKSADWSNICLNTPFQRY